MFIGQELFTECLSTPCALKLKCLQTIASEYPAKDRPVFHARPVSFGVGISHKLGDVGSLGCIVAKSGDTAWYLLSACHVLALAGAAKSGDTIVEPGRPDPAAAPFAILTDFEPLRGDGVPNAFDAALARLNRKEDVRPDMPLFGVRPTPMDAVEFQSVRKYGAGTGDTLGIVTSVRARVTLELGSGSYLFEDVIKVLGAGQSFSSGGDSGASVVDARTCRPIGLIIGGDGRETLYGAVEVKRQIHFILFPSSQFSLFDLKARFFVPTHSFRWPSCAGAVPPKACP